MSTAAVIVLVIIALLVITLNVAFVCETWEKVTKMEIGELPGKEAIDRMIQLMQEQKLIIILVATHSLSLLVI